MATITTRSGKGSPLTNNELDANFTNLNNDKQEVLAEGSFADGDKTKLDGIESGATADQTAQEIATAIDADATAEATLKSALGLGTAAYTASTDYATAAQGALADSALQSIPDNYVLNTGDAITGNLTFGDNDKAIFGAGSDLQIYHDGSNSYVTDSGTGYLYLRGSDRIYLQDAAATATYARFVNGAESTLYYNNAAKLATTSTGIDVTGTVTADGLDVNSSLVVDTATGGTTPFVKAYRASVSVDRPILQTENASTGGITSRFDGNGDISFYEDTGTTAKFFWDASAESLGIGTSSPSDLMTIQSPASGGGNGITLKRNDNGTDQRVGAISFGNNVDSDLALIAAKTSVGNSGDGNLQFYTQSQGGSATERMRIDSSGNVGIGTSSPSSLLDVDKSQNSETNIEITNTNTGSAAQVRTKYTTDGGLFTVGKTSDAHAYGGDAYIHNVDNTNIRFATNDTERMRITSSGNVGIGTSSPSTQLEIKSAQFTDSQITLDNTSSNTTSRVLFKAAGTEYGRLSGDYTQVTLQSANIPLAFRTNGAERMRIDSSGSVKIGATNAGGRYIGVSDGTTDSANYGSIQVTKPLDHDGSWHFACIQAGNQIGGLGYIDNGASRFICGIGGDPDDITSYGAQHEYSTNYLAAHVSGSERMRIDSSGNLFVAKSGYGSVNTNGFTAYSDGWIQASTTSEQTAYLNRNTSDGSILGFYKDGTTVGSIGYSTATNIAIGNTSKGIGIGTGSVFPTNGSTAISDAGLDLGYSSSRFKDLYLSGGVYLGGTGSANYLDDYEEGEYTVTFTPDSGSITLSSTIDKCRYTKIGRLVKITGRVNISSVSSPTGIVKISLPYANASLGGENSYFAAAPVFTHDVDLPTDLNSLFIELNQGLTYGRLYYVRDNVSWTNFPAQNFDGSGNEYIYFNISYTTDL